MSERISDPTIKRSMQQELAKLRHTQPSADAIRAGFRIANNKYRSAVADGDPFSTRFWAMREAFALYGAEVGVDPRAEPGDTPIAPGAMALARLLTMEGGRTYKTEEKDDDEYDQQKLY